MKKTIAVLLVLAVVMGGVFAYSDTSVKLKGSVNASEPSYSVRHVLGGSYDKTDATTYELAPSEITGVSLNTAGLKKEEFVIVYNSNIQTPRNVTIGLEVAGFTEETTGVAGPTATLSVSSVSGTMGAGNQENETLGQFDVSWTGDVNLAAGNYSALVTVKFSAL